MIKDKQIIIKEADSKEGTREKLEKEQIRKLFIKNLPEELT